MIEQCTSTPLPRLHSHFALLAADPTYSHPSMGSVLRPQTVPQGGAGPSLGTTSASIPHVYKIWAMRCVKGTHGPGMPLQCEQPE